jgi:phosphoenolpyruvate synthase/pyruvate phosphate dikinase
MIKLNKNTILDIKIGSKSSNLIELQKRDFKAPNGILLTTEDLNDIDNIKLPYKNTSLAIRSAALGEDNNNSSFAGIFKSILNVDSDNYINAIKEVYQSFYSKKSEVYQSIKKVSITPQILIQEMIESKYSVVFFIKNNEISFSFVEGACEKIVSGTEDVKEYTTTFEYFNAFIQDNEDTLIDEIGLLDFMEIELMSLANNLNKDILMDIEMTYDGNEWWILQIRELNI